MSTYVVSKQVLRTKIEVLHITGTAPRSHKQSGYSQQTIVGEQNLGVANNRQWSLDLVTSQDGDRMDIRKKANIVNWV